MGETHALSRIAHPFLAFRPNGRTSEMFEEIMY